MKKAQGARSSPSSSERAAPLPEEPPAPAPPATVSLFPMQVRASDRYTDAQGEGILIGRPSTMRGGKVVRMLVQSSGQGKAAGLTREGAWPAHERIEVRRGDTNTSVAQ